MAEATRRGKLRPNSVDSLTGKNSGNNLGEETLQIQIGEALVGILSQNDLRLQLIERSHAMYEQFFAWPAIAKRYAEFLEAAEQ